MPVLLADVRQRLSVARSRQQDAIRLLGLNVKANAGKGIPVGVARGNDSDERSESQQQQQQALADFRILGHTAQECFGKYRDSDEEEEEDAGRLPEAWRREAELREVAGGTSGSGSGSTYVSGSVQRPASAAPPAADHHAGGARPVQPTSTDPNGSKPSGSGARMAQPTSTDPNGYHKAHLDAQLSLGHAAHAVFLFFSRYEQCLYTHTYISHTPHTSVQRKTLHTAFWLPRSPYAISPPHFMFTHTPHPKLQPRVSSLRLLAAPDNRGRHRGRSSAPEASRSSQSVQRGV